MLGNIAGRAFFNECAETSTGSLLENELISDSDTCNMVSTIRLQSLLDGIALAVVGAVVVWDGIDAKEDLHVHFGLPDRFELW